MEPNVEEAERRIAEARATGAESLDLGDLGLRELPASLGHLTCLTGLYLGYSSLTAEGARPWSYETANHKLSNIELLHGLNGLRNLSLSNTGVTDLTPLQGLQALKSLDLTNTSITDLTPLQGLRELQSLALTGKGVTDVTPLRRLHALQRLNLANTSVTNLVPLQGLYALQDLDISYTGLTDFSPLQGLLTLRSIKLSGCLGLTDLAPLQGLLNLEKLEVSRADITDLTPLQKLLALKNLEISGAGVTDLTPLRELKALQNLNLSNCPKVTDLSPLDEHRALQFLNLSSCTSVSDLGPLKSLQALQSLDLSNCIDIADLTPLQGPQALQYLKLSGTRVKELAPLTGLHQLQHLFLHGCGGVTNLAPISRSQKLQTLDLSYTSVTDLTPLTGLRSLQELYLVGTLATDLAPLVEMQELRWLNLWKTGVRDVTLLGGLRELRHLDLAGTEVTDLTPLGVLPLQFLHLGETGVTNLSPLSGIRELQKLYLSNTNVVDLSPIACLDQLRLLDLYGCRPALALPLNQILASHQNLRDLFADEVIGIPREVLSQFGHDNCLSRLQAYLAEINQNAEPENELKVILLGNGRVGKTQLCRRFRGEPFDDSVPSTHGVQIWREELRIPTADQETAFQVNWWDFGGQDIYHGTHALFLRNRAVFLILWNPTFEDRKEFSENGLILRNQPLAYWLDYVRSLAGEGSPVIVVQSQCDTFADRRPAPSKPDGIDFFESCSFSSQTDFGREILNGQLRHAIRYLLERNGALEIGHGRAEVRRQLYAWRSEDQQRQPGERKHRTLTLDEFRGLCGEVGGIVSCEHALDYFHQTGVVFYRPDLFSERIVLDQDWALEAVYTVFDRGRVVPWLRDSGRFTREDLAWMIWQRYSAEEQGLFLRMMTSCGVCFPCGKTLEGEDRYVAPDLLPKFEAMAGRLQAWKEDTETASLRLEYRFFHTAVIRNLMSEIGRQAGDLAEYWKYGFWFKDGKRDSQVLVQFEDMRTNDRPGAGALVLKTQGRDPLGLLREIRKEILRQRIGEEPEEFLTIEGKTVARRALDGSIEGRVLDLQRSPVDAAPFACFFEIHEVSRKLDIDPQTLSEKEKRPAVYISYAWEDGSPEGKVRGEVAEKLCAALEQDRFQPVRDRDKIRFGEFISTFIERLVRADQIVAVISDKYLRSPYCMYEAYRIWQKWQGDQARLAEHLVPVVLPEVKISSIPERRIYSSYWNDQYNDVAAMTTEELLRLDPESLQEARLIREFANHMDSVLVFIRNVLMPRNLQTHFDNDFQAVRDALRRPLAKKDP